MSTNRSELPAYAGPACLGLAANSPLAQQAGVRDALKGLPDVPNADWPYLLLALCGAVLGFLALWVLAKAVRSACGPDPADNKQGRTSESER
jgi:hypothetical protein